MKFELRLMTATAILLTVAWAASGCGSASDASRDPNKPAVVQAPPVILPSDTAKPDTTEATQGRVEVIRRSMALDYSVLSSAMVLGDRGMLGTIYASDAILQTPDSTFRGIAAVAAELTSFAHRVSMSDFRRISRSTAFLPDSVVSDSGDFLIKTRRGASDVTVQQGAYAAKWRMHAPPRPWTLTADRLYRASAAPGDSRSKAQARRTKPGSR